MTETSLNLLQSSLAEAQVTVRGYDTKAQICGVGYVFALGIVGQVSNLLPKAGGVDWGTVLAAWGIVILPTMLFGYVLYPTRKSAEAFANTSAIKAEHILYIDPKKLDSIEDLKSASERADPATEYSFELLKVSQLRDLKRSRFLRALFSALIAFLFLFGSHLARAL